MKKACSEMKSRLDHDLHTPDGIHGLRRTFQKHTDIFGLTEENKLPFVHGNMAPIEE